MEEKKKSSKLKIIVPVSIVIVILVVVGIVFFTGKGGGNRISKEQMLETATKLDINKLKTAMTQNQLRAKEEYIGKIYKYDGFIENITDNYVSMGDLKVYLSKDELKQLNSNQAITVVGELQITENNNYELNNAYFVSDTIDITMGIVEIPHSVKVVYNSRTRKNDIVDRTDKSKNWYCILKSKGQTYYLDECIPVENRDYYYPGKPTEHMTTIRDKQITTLYVVTLNKAKVVKVEDKAMILDFEEIHTMTTEEAEKLVNAFK